MVGMWNGKGGIFWGNERSDGKRIRAINEGYHLECKIVN
jgi:hypothetical protein